MPISPEKQEQLHKERRKLIVDSAYYLFFTKGYKNTSIADIAAEAGISKGLVYRYFTSKEELILAEREETFSCLNGFSSNPSPKDALLDFLNLSFRLPGKDDYIGQIYVLYEAILEGDVNTEEFNRDTVHNFGIRFFTPIFEQGQKMGQLKDGDPAVLADMYWHIIVGYVFNRKPEEWDKNNNELPEKILSLFLA